MFNILLYENWIKYFKKKPASFDLIQGMVLSVLLG